MGTYMFLDCRYLAHQLKESSSQTSCQRLTTLCVPGETQKEVNLLQTCVRE